MFILTPLLSFAIVTADVQIEHVVPETAIAFISTPNIAQCATHLKEAGVCDAISGLITNICEENGVPNCFAEDGQCAVFFDEFGIDKKNLTPPSGYAGFAMYPVIDYEVNTVGIGLIAMIELDEEEYGELLTTKYEEYVQTLEIEHETIQLAGRDVWMFQTESPQQLQIPQFNFSPDSFDRGYFVYSDGYAIVGTDPEAIAAVFSALDGQPEKDMLIDNPDYTALVERCGSDGDMFAGILLTNLADMIVQLDQTGMAMMFLPSLKTLFGDIDGIAESVRISPSSEIFVEARYTALMNDGRSGLLSLLGENEAQQPIPNFVQADAISYSQGHIDLSKVGPLIKDTIMSNPMLGMQMAPLMEQMENGLNLFLNPLGSTYHSFSTGQIPFSAESIGYLFAIECTDEEAFNNALNLLLPSSGAQSSDFLGHQIFTIDLGAGIPMPMPFPMNISISVAGGYAFFGLSTTVEEALRTVANPKENTSKHRIFASTSYLENDDVSSWGYVDIAKSIKIQTALSESMADEMFEEMESFDPEMAAELRNEFIQQSVMQTMITNTITALFGPMSWNVTTDESGLSAHAVLLKSQVE